MEFLEKIGDFFTAFFGTIERIITRLFGASNDRQIGRLGFNRSKTGETTITPGSTLDQINKFEPELQKLSDEELRQTASRLRARLAKGETLDDLLPEAFASVRESGRRHLKMRHYDTQMIGGYVLHHGNIAEMVTGEGKTLVATLPAFLNALAGKVHVVTVNDYLARRDMEWMAPLFTGLGLTIGAIQANMGTEEKNAAYACDITYGTNNEFGFDYLRDNMKPTRELQVLGQLNYAIVDEIDNILIDEARTPLIISGPAEDDTEKYRKADRVARQLRKDVDFEIKEKEHSCHLTEEGVRHAEELAGVESFYTAGNMEWPHNIDNALKAHHLYKRDVNYVVMQGEIIIVDEFTGRLMKGRQWSDGLHQAVEAKESVPIKEENQTLATITLQNYFKLYKKLSGMTGTAMTEANEFWKIYKLDVIAIPTNRPMLRINHHDVIYRTEREKYNAIVEEIREIHKIGCPVLVGTTSIEKSEHLSDLLKKYGIKHEVLNAKHHEREADIIAQAGRLGAVTIATNMAGRGTDIILGGNSEQMAWNELKHTYASRLDVPKVEWDGLAKKIADQEGMVAEGRKVAELGGLHVIGTERHEARRIDLQLRGRSGRQGDPGSSRFFLSLEDDLMRIFAGDWVKDMLTRLGMQEGEAIESRMVSRRIEGAQKKVEERNFETRKSLLEYDEVMDQQRRRVYGYRQHILDGGDPRELILGMIKEQTSVVPREVLAADQGAKRCAMWAVTELGLEVEPSDLRNMDGDQAITFLREEAGRQAADLIIDKIEEDLPSDADDEREWNWLSLSKWANARWGLNTNDRELKKIGRDEVYDYLNQRAEEAIQRVDLSIVKEFFRPDFGQLALCDWLELQFTLKMTPDQFKDRTPAEASEIAWAEVQKLYKDKEIHFPVDVGMSKFLAENADSGERYNREGLVRWANDRFHANLQPDDFKGKSREEIRTILTNCSRTYYAGADQGSKIDEHLDRAFGHESNGHAAGKETLGELVRWAQQDLRLNVEVDDLTGMSRDEVRRELTEDLDARYRPELRQAERSLILELLDTAWKEHLYQMDHLRQGIGLVGYAQKDPKVEYKREGMKAFDMMWKRISTEATQFIFRIEKESPGFVGGLWKITATTHEESPVPLPMPNSDGEEFGGPNDRSSNEPPSIDPIRNKGERVGRNDPCPCGSGKKFKNCHMKR